MKNPSKIIRSENLTWPELERREYKETSTGYRNIVRYVLLGEKEEECGLNMQTRYFEISEGGYSSLERHRHPHTVVIVRGKGSMILGERIAALEYTDAVYIAPGTVHQFHADRGEPLGFLCIVDRYRDRPQIPKDEDELAEWITDSEVRKKARI
ncbi:MAG: cupin domain-containing protein [Bacteroidota bacterium]